MGSLESLITWPPTGWKQFKDIQPSLCQSLAKNPSKGKIYGLQYKIETVPLFKDEKKYLRYDVLIDGWEYSILNESIEYPVLSFTLLDCFDDNLPQECYITDIRSYSSLIPHTKKSAARAVSAGIFLMKQISNGFVPDVNRVLQVYKLHPTQSFLYSREKKLEFDLQAAFDKGYGNQNLAKKA